MKLLKSLTAAAAILALTGAAQAALVDLGGGMIYDTTLNITWLQNWNTNGRMNWTAADNWAKKPGLSRFRDWRLPTSLNADGTGPCVTALRCSGSEMGHMFCSNWSATAGNDFSTGTNAANLALFTNVQSLVYWSGTEFAPIPVAAWGFFTDFGTQNPVDKFNALYAVAVRPGDVAAAVPESQTLALALLALGATMVVRRRRPG